MCLKNSQTDVCPLVPRLVLRSEDEEERHETSVLPPWEAEVPYGSASAPATGQQCSATPAESGARPGREPTGLGMSSLTPGKEARTQPGREVERGQAEGNESSGWLWTLPPAQRAVSCVPDPIKSDFSRHTFNSKESGLTGS